MREKPTHFAVNELLFLCRKIAIVHLRRKANNGHLPLDYFKLTLEDLALDCIADLFHQGENGTLLQMKAYFEGLNFHSATEEELLSHLRRLVFGKINDNLFRLYNEHDPSLGKILRNIKKSIHELHNFEIVERFGEPHIAPTMCEPLRHSPIYERLQLESLLRFGVKGNDNIPTILAGLSHLLRDQEEYSRLVPLMDVAVVIRSIYSTSYAQEQYSFEIEHAQTLRDSRVIIREACNQVSREYVSTYVNKKKLSPIIYAHYFEVIEENLLQTILGTDGKDFSYFDKLKSRIPDLTKEEYHKQYKSHIEYLGRISYEKAISMLKKSF